MLTPYSELTDTEVIRIANGSNFDETEWYTERKFHQYAETWLTDAQIVSLWDLGVLKGVGLLMSADGGTPIQTGKREVARLHSRIQALEDQVQELEGELFELSLHGG